MGDSGIPKIIHQIWIGDAARPDEWMDTVKDFAREYDYEYKVWGDVKELGLDEIPGLAAVYKGFGHELAGRADIIRLLALYKYGGIYIDADSVIMKPEKFANFLKKNRAGVFFGWENLTAARTRKLGIKTRRLVANGMIGAKKEHPFFRRLLEGVVDNAARLSEESEARRAVGKARNATAGGEAVARGTSRAARQRRRRAIGGDCADGVVEGVGDEAAAIEVAGDAVHCVAEERTRALRVDEAG
jgi:hypothetical protein